MNSQFKSKYFQYLNKKNGNKGFTLIELLVVVIIIGVLAAIALPNLLSQVAKGRQAEAKTNLGAINRAQQAYRLEKATFGTLDQLPIVVSTQYYDIPTTGTGGGDVSATFADHQAKAKSNLDDDIRDYVSAVSQDSTGAFASIICEGKKPDTAFANAAAANACPNTNYEAVK